MVEFLQSEGYIRFRADYEASSKSIYKAYKVWCEDNVRKPLSANRLSSELTQNAAVYNVEPTNNIYSGGRRYEGPEPTLENTSFYVVGPDGTKYFYCGNLCIKISEHFADGGKQMDELVEDAVRHHAGRDSSAPTFLNAV